MKILDGGKRARVILSTSSISLGLSRYFRMSMKVFETWVVMTTIHIFIHPILIFFVQGLILEVQTILKGQFVFFVFVLFFLPVFPTYTVPFLTLLAPVPLSSQIISNRSPRLCCPLTSTQFTFITCSSTQSRTSGLVFYLKSFWK